MTPVSDLRRLSKNLPLSRVVQMHSAIPRSQSDTSYSSLASAMDKKPRRGSDWSETMNQQEISDDMKEILRPFQIQYSEQEDDDSETSSLLQRRMSKVITSSKSSSNCSMNNKNASSKPVARSQSVRMSKKAGDIRQRNRGSSIPSEVSSSCNGVKVKERTISNRSLPLPGEENYTRLRNFCVTPKGVINRGDSFRCKAVSNSSPTVSTERVEKGKIDKVNETLNNGTVPVNPTPVYKVLLIGAPNVGKTSLKNQFMTSEYICAYEDHQEDEINRTVTIVLNSEESELEFEEESLVETNISTKLINCFQPDAIIVVYSVTNRRSYLQARQLLAQVGQNTEAKVVILVGNKTDLARLRAVTTEEGRSLAKERDCKFIETSVAINHQVDELLVGILTQIRMKVEAESKKQEKKKKKDDQSRRTSIYSGSKASNVLKKILRRACLKSKSCDNLHVL